jgi:hypothetical protein
MADLEKQKAEVIAELSDLTRQQIKAVKDATFMGWDPAELAAYEQRNKRIAWLRQTLGSLSTTD